MGAIKDIRLFYSTADHADMGFGHKKLNAAIHRVVMKLRERGFSLGEFDHLYVNFTASAVPNGMAPADKPVDRYHPWFRFYDVQTEPELLGHLMEGASIPRIVSHVEQLLITFFATEAFPEETIRESISCAAEQGEAMRMHFKEKTSANRRAIVYLRYSDQCKYVPLVQVFDRDGRLLLEAELPEMVLLDRLGEIQLSSKKVTIKPRKNGFTKEMKPLVFLLPE